MTVSRIATFAATCHAMKAVKRMSDTLCKNSIWRDVDISMKNISLKGNTKIHDEVIQHFSMVNGYGLQ